MKFLLTLLFSFSALILLAQAPGNDDCLGLIDLGEVPYCSDPGQYTNVDATASIISDVDTLNIPSCFNGGQSERDVWFQFTIPADGSIVDVSIAVFGNVDGNGTLQLPQLAVYRGDCELNGLAELACVSAAIGENEVHLDLFNLTPGLPYYLRINDYSQTAAPNWGTFKLCVEKYLPDINIGDAPGSQSCTGTLWDSGGPDSTYSSNENLSFTICPQEFHQCIILNVVNYDTEDGWDGLQFFAGDDTGSPEIAQLTGAGQNIELQFSSDCATIQFTSDGDITYDGFQITWTCSPQGCTVPPPTSCDEPALVGNLPFSATDLSNCQSGNSVGPGPCNADFLEGNDYVFAYTSPGFECIHVTATGTLPGAGIAVYDNCPNLAGTNCIASAGGLFGPPDPVVQAAFLENPGTYYLVFGQGFDCGSFDFQVDTITCPVVLPSASVCDNALSLDNCGTALPQIIALTPGAGDPNFLVDGVNQGCFLAPQFNYTFFYFTAGADGQFGFSVQAADPAEASDIDYAVWGPIDSIADICNFTSTHQPVRSSWAAGADPTGLADIHPVTGLPVTDDFDCGDPSTPGTGNNADDFTRLLDVQEGKIYVVLLDDFGSAIEQSGISIDFGGTTAGVLDQPLEDIIVSGDTAVCAGEPVQLSAGGGLAYGWTPVTNLSCASCPNPIAVSNVSTQYTVQIATTCQTIFKNVKIKVYDLDLGPDVTVCNGAEFKINPHPFDSVQYNWVGGPGLSCYDCPTPTVSGLTTGVYTFIGTLNAPDCVASDTVQITVVDGDSPVYEIAGDVVICAGGTVNLGGAGQAGTFYQWISEQGNLSTEANPAVTPLETTVYYLEASNNSCPVTVLDSVLVTVFQVPILHVQADTSICLGESVRLGFSPEADSVTYAWTPINGLDDPTSANPLATPTQTTTYTLTTTNGACVETRQVKINVTALSLQISVPDTLAICQGSQIQIQAQVVPTAVPIIWTPSAGLTILNNGKNVTAKPFETTFYTATASLNGCIRTRTVYIAVDSLPVNLNIYPDDTTICQGAKVLLTSPIYEPGLYPEIDFAWTPGAGQLTPDSLYNLVVQPTQTTAYRRITINGACRDTAFGLVTVIPQTQIQIVPADTTICPGQSVALTLLHPPGVQDVQWTPANGLSCSDCDTPTATPTGTTTYSVSATSQGCPTGASATIHVLPPPGLQFPADVNLCPGEDITLNLIDDPTATYQWTSTDPAFNQFTASQPTVTPTLPVTTYTVTATNGCPATGQITVNLALATLTVSDDTLICKGGLAVLSAQGSLPGTYQWSDGQTGAAISVSPDATTPYTLTYTFGDGCQIQRDLIVQVQGQNADVTFPADQQICPGDSVTLNLTPVAGATYVWTSTPAGFTSTNPAPTVSPTQNTTYTVVATLGNCAVTQSVQIQAPNATLSVSTDTTLCPGEPVTLIATALPGGGGNFVWSFQDTTANGAMLTTAPTASGVYGVTYTYGDGCTLQDSVQVEVAPNFSVGITTKPVTDTLHLGDDVTLTAVISPTQTLAGFQFQWLENGAQPPLGTAQLLDLENFSSNALAVYYQVVVTSPAGCVQSAVKNFIIQQPVRSIPNAFSPDGDGTNDDFGIILDEDDGTVERIEIFSRWGEKIFTKDGPDARWNGRIGTGDKAAPSDVYVYVIRWRRGDGSLQVEKGDVTLLR